MFSLWKLNSYPSSHFHNLGFWAFSPSSHHLAEIPGASIFVYLPCSPMSCPTPSWSLSRASKKVWIWASHESSFSIWKRRAWTITWWSRKWLLAEKNSTSIKLKRTESLRQSNVHVEKQNKTNHSGWKLVLSPTTSCPQSALCSSLLQHLPEPLSWRFP